MRRKFAAALAFAALSLVGCRGGAHRHSDPKPGPEPVCHHHDRCGHHWDGHRWILVRGHVHKHGCGHHFRDGRWVIVVR